MTSQRLLITLTVVNVVLLVFSLGQTHAVVAEGIATVLRGRALEIVDDHGRIRASISVLPADPAVKMPDGTTGYPETVLLRLINSKGRPNIKIAATDLGGALLVGGDSDPNYVQILTRGSSPTLKLINKAGREKLIEP
jgi:hypothetical protein